MNSDIRLTLTNRPAAASTAIQNFTDDGIALDDYDHPSQSWEAVREAALEFSLDTTNEMERLRARLYANNVIGNHNHFNHPILNLQTINLLAAEAQMPCPEDCETRSYCNSCDARELLIAYNRRFISKQVRRYRFATRYGFEYQDLIQIGIMGLLQALETWESDGGMDFLGWSKYSIRQELRAAITNDGLLMRIPYQKRILQSKLPQIREELTEELGYNPSYSEMALYIRISGYDKGCQTNLIPPEEIAFLESYHQISLNEKIQTEDDENLELQDLIPGNAEDPADEVARRELIEKLLSSLSENEELVIRNYHKSPLGNLEAKEVVEMLPPSPKTGKKYTEAAVSSIFDRATDRMKFEAINMGFKCLGDFYE